MCCVIILCSNWYRDMQSTHVNYGNGLFQYIFFKCSQFKNDINNPYNRICRMHLSRVDSNCDTPTRLTGINLTEFYAGRVGRRKNNHWCVNLSINQRHSARSQYRDWTEVSIMNGTGGTAQQTLENRWENYGRSYTHWGPANISLHHGWVKECCLCLPPNASDVMVVVDYRRRVVASWARPPESLNENKVQSLRRFGS